MSSSTPAGWYPDPTHPTQPWTNKALIPQRYFDGTDWTDQIQLPRPVAPTDPGQYNGSATKTIGILVGIAAVPIVIALIAVLAAPR